MMLSDGGRRRRRRVLLIVSLTGVVLQTDLRSTPQGTLGSGGRLPATLRLTPPLTLAFVLLPLHFSCPERKHFFLQSMQEKATADSRQNYSCSDVLNLCRTTSAGIKSFNLTS